MNIHDELVSRLIVENLATKGSVTLEEAKFYTDFTRDILNKIVEEATVVARQAREINESTRVGTNPIVKKLLK